MSACRLTALATVALAAAGCPGPQVRKGGDAERTSGPDRALQGARQRQLEVAVADTVSFRRGDRTDWHYFDVVEFGGRLSVSLHWDDTQSELDLGIFDHLGEKLLLAPQTPGQDKNVELSPIEPGRYYVRVRAVEASDDSPYALVARWSVIPTPAPEPETTAVPEKEVPKVGGGGSRAVTLATIPGRVVQSFPEDGALILHIDKGSAAGVRVGTLLNVLDGPSGYTPLANGGCQVIKVTDENRSIARCGKLTSLFKNNRVTLRVK